MSSTSTIDIPVVRTQTHRKKTPLVAGVIKAATLVRSYVIPRRDSKRKTGYQRDVSITRVNRLVKDLIEKRVDLPTSVLLNLRDFDITTQLTERSQRLFFNPGDEPFYVVDGQHRIEALARLVQNDPDRWNGFEIPFVCMLGAKEDEEMEQFYVVNSTAKSVRTDLALDLLKQRAESDKSVMASLVERGEDWKVRAQAITEELAKTSLWVGRIRFPGDTTDATTISSGGMVNSLKNILATPYFGNVAQHYQVKILETYWQGIRNVLIEVFDAPERFALQKSTGVAIMHILLTTILEIVRSKGMSVTEASSYEEILREALLELQGDTGIGETAKGADFWLAGEEGAAGSFSSNAGRRVLLAKIRSSLPELEIE